MENDKLNNLLDKRAITITKCIGIYADEFIKHILGKIPGSKPIDFQRNLSDADIASIKLISMVGYLYFAQQFFWENVIPNENVAIDFEKKLYLQFHKYTNTDPMPYIQEISQYIKQMGHGGQASWVGSRILKALDKKCIILMTEISINFIILINHCFYLSLKNFMGIIRMNKNTSGKVLKQIRTQINISNHFIYRT